MAQLTRSPTPTSLLRLGRGYTIAVGATAAALFITFALPPVFDRISMKSSRGRAVVPAGLDRDVQIGTRLADSPTMVVGDALRLQQIFGNLLANAVTFTPGGGSITLTQSEGSGRGTTMTVTLPLATDVVGAVPRLEGSARHRDIC
jgi:signal transduction histidine kinase